MYRNSDIDRFNSKVQRLEPDECWLYTGGLFNRTRYGQFFCRRDGKKRNMLAHRVAYELRTGKPVPDGMYVCHICDNMQCVNPIHLWLGTAADNARDRERKGRGADHAGEKHGASKLTDERVAYLRSLPGPISIAHAKELGARFGVNYNHIYRVRTGTRWLA